MSLGFEEDIKQIFKFIYVYVFLSLTCSKRHIGKLLPCSITVIEVAIGSEFHPLHPGVTQTVVDSWRDADLMADRDGVTCCSLRKKDKKRWLQCPQVLNSSEIRNFRRKWTLSFVWMLNTWGELHLEHNRLWFRASIWNKHAECKLCLLSVLTWRERAILIMVMMGGRRRRVSFRHRSNKLRSFSYKHHQDNNNIRILNYQYGYHAFTGLLLHYISITSRGTQRWSKWPGS